MKEIKVQIPDEAYDAIAEEAEREYRNIPQQASFLLLTWSREVQEKRHKGEKVARPAVPARREEVLNGQLGS